MATLSVEELNKTSDQYFRQHSDLAVYLSKPFTNAELVHLMDQYRAEHRTQP